MNWHEISTEQLSIDFLKEHKEQVNWLWVSEKIILNEEILEMFRDKIAWTKIVKNPTFSFDLLCFAEEYEEVIWYWIVKEYPLTYEMYLRFKDKLDTVSISVLSSNKNKQFHVLLETYETPTGRKGEYKVVEEKEAEESGLLADQYIQELLYLNPTMPREDVYKALNYKQK